MNAAFTYKMDQLASSKMLRKMFCRCVVDQWLNIHWRVMIYHKQFLWLFYSMWNNYHLNCGSEKMCSMQQDSMQIDFQTGQFVAPTFFNIVVIRKRVWNPYFFWNLHWKGISFMMTHDILIFWGCCYIKNNLGLSLFGFAGISYVKPSAIYIYIYI